MSATPIEALALEYILARRMKLDAKARRKLLPEQCTRVREEGDYEKCIDVMGPEGERLHDDDLCPTCRQFRVEHREFVQRSREAGTALRKLERAVSAGVKLREGER